MESRSTVSPEPVRVILDLLTVKFLLGYSKRPIHFFGTIGLVTSFLGCALLAMMTVQRYAFSQPMGNRPLLSLSIMMVIIGIQFLVFGLLAEVLARTYYESQNKPTYFVKNFFGSAFDANSNHVVEWAARRANKR